MPFFISASPELKKFCACRLYAGERYPAKDQKKT